MEKSQSVAKTTGLWEKIQKSARRISHIFGTPIPASANNVLRQLSLKKLVASQFHETTDSASASEVNIPIIRNHNREFESPIVMNGKDNGRVIMVGCPKIQPVDKAAKSAKPTTVNVHIHGQKGDDEVAPKMAKVITPNKEAKQAHVVPSMEKANKPNQKPEAAAPTPSKVILIENQMMPKTKDQLSSEMMTKKKATPRNDGVEESKKHEVSDGAEKFTNYINSVRNKLRTSSNIVGEENISSNQRAPTRTPTRQDSFNDKVANYINRARNNMRTSSNIGDG